MKTFLSNDKISYIQQGDCLELMKEMPDASVDFTITSPPYDNLRTYNGNIQQWSFKKFEAIAEELYRVTSDGGVVVWVVADMTIKGSETGTSFRQALHFMQCGFNLHDTMIWAKDTMLFPNTTRYGQSFEYMFVFSKGKPKTVHKIQDRKNKWAGTKIHGTTRKTDGDMSRKSNHNKTLVKEYGERLNVWQMPSEKKNKTGHPAVFPEQIARDHILSWTNEGDVVLDPFIGSGTTAIAAIKTKRRYIGFEIDGQYFETAAKRVMETERMVCNA